METDSDLGLSWSNWSPSLFNGDSKGSSSSSSADSTSDHYLGTPFDSASDEARQKELKKYISSVISYLNNTSTLPLAEPQTIYGTGHAPTVGFDKNTPILSEHLLLNCLQINDTDKEDLTDKYTRFSELVESDKAAAPSSSVYSGRGVVFVGGGKHTPMALVGAYMLRKTDPLLPIELFVANNDEYEAELCDNILWPDYKIKCRILTDYFPQSFMDKFEVKAYNFKILALLASSFDDTLILDADNMPAQNVEEIFVKEPYISSKYITWPDYWRRTTSPHFYDIIGVNVSEALRESNKEWGHDYSPEDLHNVTHNVFFHDRKGTMPDVTTESGQLVVSKLTHYKSLLRTLYFNIHGYKHYYPMLTQGAPGQGDKDTFVAGALASGVIPYRVKQIVRTAGYQRTNANGEVQKRGTAMLQSNPVEDLVVSKQGPGAAPPSVMFLHSQMVKYNMRFLLEQEKEFFVDDSTRIRFCGLPSANSELWNYQDIELHVWQAANWTACGVPARGYIFRDWKDADVDIPRQCSMVSEHLTWLKKTHFS